MVTNILTGLTWINNQAIQKLVSGHQDMFLFVCTMIGDWIPVSFHPHPQRRTGYKSDRMAFHECQRLKT